MAVVATNPIEADHQAPQIDVETPDTDPIRTVVRAMRGRWRAAFSKAFVLGATAAFCGYIAGTKLFESQAILRVFPQESNILYATGEASVLKTFDSFVKAETTYVASNPVMQRAASMFAEQNPDPDATLSASDLSRSIEIKRSDSLIVLKTKSKQAEMAQAKLDVVVAAYLALKAEAKASRAQVRLAELRMRESELVDRLASLRATQLEVGGEFGQNAITKAHIEKLAQIDGLSARKSEVAATLQALETASGGASADTSDEEIMRATLLDRAMADLNFERAKLMSELAGLQAGYNGQSNLRFQLKEESLLDEIAVIETALADRREQIKVLGQTGALTDTSAAGGDDTSIDEIRALFTKVSGQLETARLEARDLNRRRIELDQIEHDISEAQTLLEETRRALEVIRLESGRALPGYAVLMSPASLPMDPVGDSRKMLAAGGFVGGSGLAILLTFFLGLRDTRVRFAESLADVGHRVPVLQVSAADDSDAQAADVLRNELQLHPLRAPRVVGKAPVIAVARAENGSTIAFARSLAESYARANMSTLIIDADINPSSSSVSANRWRSFLANDFRDLSTASGDGMVYELPDGPHQNMTDARVSAPMVRDALSKLVRTVDVIVVAAGSLTGCLSAQFVLSASDVGVLVVDPDDPKATVLSQIDRLDALPRQGAVVAVRNALPDDPWLAVRT